MLDTIKGYLVEEKVGSGGFGVVYRARQSSPFDREVAIKVIQPHYANQPDFIRRFESEAQLVARLEHPFIVPLYDYWREPDSAYLVMRWLSGGNIHDALKNGPLDVKFSMNILQQVALALTTAHQQGVIHRDVKPSNILLDTHGNAYLADFGIAKDLVYHDSNATHPDAIIGSPGYLAPEQARREALSPRTDVYSLGVTLYEMLAGEHPFKDANTVEKLYNHLYEALPLLENIDPAIADAVNDVIQKATCKNPIDRFADPLEMVAAFRAAIQYAEEAPENIVAILTRREQEILQMIVEGKSNKEIAAALFVTVSTVRTHLRQAYKKLNVRTRMQAIVRVRELNLVVDGDATVVGDFGSSAYIMLPEAHNPYKGLNAFTAADSKDFFGRAALIKRLLHRMQDDVENRRFLAIVGPSGSGKSSLVKAGLVPAIWRGEMKGSDDWYTIDLIPGAHPLDELEVALQRVMNVANDNIHDHLMRDARGLVRVGQLILPEDTGELLIVIDQFEEVFTLVEDEEQRTYFLNLIQTAVSDPRSRVRIVITLRADFYDRPLQYPQFGELLRNRMETILPLSAEELEASIVQPAKAVGVKYADGVVASIIADVNYQPGALPLLQYALTELFDRHENRLITRQHYQDIGGTVGAIAQRADTLFEEFDETGQQLARQLFLRLVTLGEGTEDTRRRVELRELLALTEQSDLAYEIIDAYAAYRLLSLDHDPATRQPMVEVAHEAILREWERLRKWLNDSRDDIKTQRSLAHASQDWADHKKDRAYLLRESRLEQFKEWAERTDLVLTPQEHAFVNASVLAEDQSRTQELQRIAQKEGLERRVKRGLQTLVAVFLVAAIVAIGLAVFALGERSTAQQERDNAEQARTQAEREAAVNRSLVLASNATDALETGYPDLALLLALESVNLDSPPADAVATLQEVTYNPGTQRILDLGDKQISAIALTPDGSAILAADYNCLPDWGGLQKNCYPAGNIGMALWDAETGDFIQRFDPAHTVWVNFVAISPTGDYAISGGDDGLLIIWDIETGAVVRQIATEYDSVLRGAFDPIGQMIAYTGGDVDESLQWITSKSYDVYLVSVPTGEPIQQLIGHQSLVTAITFSATENLLLSGDFRGVVYEWDLNTMTQVRSFEHEAEVRYILLASDTERLIVQANFAASVWDFETGERLSNDWTTDFASVTGALSRDGQTAYIGTASTITVRDTSTGDISFTYKEEGTFDMVLHPTEPILFLATSSIDAVRRVYVGQRANIRYFEPMEWEDGEEFLFNLDVDDAGQRVVASGLFRGQIVVWDTGSGQIIQEIVRPDVLQPWGIALSSDGRYVVTSSISVYARDDVDTNVRIGYWDLETGEEIRYLQHGEHFVGYPLLAAMNHQETQAIIGLFAEGGTPQELVPFKEVLLWDLATGKILHRLRYNPDYHAAVGLAFSPDDSLAAVGFDIPYVIQLWDVQQGILIKELTGAHSGGVDFVEFLPDGQHLLSGGRDGSLFLWDINSGQVIRSYNGHRTRILGIAVSSDLHYVVAGGQTMSTLWNFDTAEIVQQLDIPSRISGFSPDNTEIYGGFGPSTNTPGAWTISTPSLEETLVWVHENRYIRDFTPEECQRYTLITCPDEVIENN